LIKTGEARGTSPITLAALFASLELDSRAAFIAHQNGIATSMLGAALRLMKVSHLDTQAILFDMNSHAEMASERAAATRLEDMSGFALLVEILSAVHAKSHVRLFMN
jgi:urease accessory protein